MTYEIFAKSWLGYILNNLMDISRTYSIFDYTDATPWCRELGIISVQRWAMRYFVFFIVVRQVLNWELGD